MSRGTIVLVEDEENLRRLGETILSRMGFSVLAFEDAESAIAIISSVGDLVLLATDMSLPGMSGVQLAHGVRALNQMVPILVMSGHDEDEIEDAGGIPAPGKILQKPVGLVDLRAAVDEMCA